MSTLLLLDNLRFKVTIFHNEFVILKIDNPQSTYHIGKKIWDQNFNFIDEVIATEVEICLKVNNLFTREKLNKIADLNFKKSISSGEMKIPVWFNAKNDIQNVIEHTGKNESEIIAILEKSFFEIAMLGFLPGFVYMKGLDPILHTPRKQNPSKYIEADSLAIGNNYLGIYSLPSPGGWHVIGQLACSVLNIPELPPLLISENKKIKLIAISENEFKEIKKNKVNLLAYNG